MKTPASTLAILVMVILSASMVSARPQPACRPVTHLGVSGCELLPDQTCLPGYHKQAVGPTNPQMKAPTRLMCVPDKPSSKKHHSQAHSKPKAKESVSQLP
jgi:hypothetical protein